MSSFLSSLNSVRIWKTPVTKCFIPFTGEVTEATRQCSHISVRVTSELIKPCAPCTLMGKKKKCFSTRRLLGTCHTCWNLYEAQRCPTRESASLFRTRQFQHSSGFQNELMTSAEVPLCVGFQSPVLNVRN